jgi:hypothetical protein
MEYSPASPHPSDYTSDDGTSFLESESPPESPVNSSSSDFEEVAVVNPILFAAQGVLHVCYVWILTFWPL